MRKTIIAAIILLISLPSITNSQLIRGFGIKAGATISNQDWNYTSDFESNFKPENRTGLNIGLFAELLDIALISIVTELNYIQKGVRGNISKTTLTGIDGNGELVISEARIDYLNITTLGKVRFNYALFSPYIVLGPKIDFEINKSNKLIDEDLNKNRLGLKVGFGTEVNVLPVTLMAEILYDADFNELYYNNNLEINSNSFDLRVGVLF